MKLATVLFFFLAIFVQPAYAFECGSGGITPLPTCSSADYENMVNSGSSNTIVVHAPTQPPPIVTVVITAAPTPMPTIIYKVIYRTATPTLTPTQEPTATPSAAKAPTPTKKPDVKSTQQKLNLFQSIAHFFQNIFSIFKKL